MSASVQARENPLTSPDEEDALTCSRKKVRVGEGEFSTEQSMVLRDEEWMHEEESQNAGPPTKGCKWKSFKEAVINESIEEEEEEEWWTGEGWKERCRVEMIDKGPDVIFLLKEKERLAKKWRNALIVKLLGRMVNQEYLERKLHQIWAKYGEVEIIDVGSGFSVVKFSDAHDYDLALMGGPWLVYDHYLSVQPWKQDFNPDVEVISKVVAWIRIAKLSLDYYDKGTLFVIGSQVGRVLKVDVNMIRRKKGRFARLCVELDLDAPLRPVVLVNGMELRVQYESIHLICMQCGRYGHERTHCPYGSKEQNKERENGFDMGQNNIKDMEGGPAEGTSVEQGAMATIKKDFGVQYEPWMVVQRPRRALRPSIPNGKGSEKGRQFRVNPVIESNGSRFNALVIETEEAPRVPQKQSVTLGELMADSNQERDPQASGISMSKRVNQTLRQSNGLGSPRTTHGPLIKDLKQEHNKNTVQQSDMEVLMRAREKLEMGLRENMEVDLEMDVRSELQEALRGVLEERNSQRQKVLVPREGTGGETKKDDNPYDPGAYSQTKLSAYNTPLELTQLPERDVSMEEVEVVDTR